MSNENIQRGLADADQARRERVERRERQQDRGTSTFGADAATLSEWLDDGLIAYEDLSLAQRIGVGFHDRAVERGDYDEEGDNQ